MRWRHCARGQTDPVVVVVHLLEPVRLDDHGRVAIVDRGIHGSGLRRFGSFPAERFTLAPLLQVTFLPGAAHSGATGLHGSLRAVLARVGGEQWMLPVR